MKLVQILRKATECCKSASTSHSRLFSSHQIHSLPPQSASFGIAFDIDGVILRGNIPIGGSSRALRRLYDDSGNLRVPYVFLTNGGSVPESKRAAELTKLLDVNILAWQVIQGHSPFKQLVQRFENELVIAVGRREPVAVMSEYGFKNVLSVDEYASYFENIDPLAPYKSWTWKLTGNRNGPSGEMATINDPCSHRVKAVFIVSASVDWSRDIQGLFPTERLGMGAFRIALESIFNRIYPNALKYTSYGKPNPSAFRTAENVLMQIVPHGTHPEDGRQRTFKTLYMIGDNPSVDIRGAREAGSPWFSILTRTGVFKGEKNHANDPADLVVDNVEQAVDYILSKEGISS